VDNGVEIFGGTISGIMILCFVAICVYLAIFDKK